VPAKTTLARFVLRAITAHRWLAPAHTRPLLASPFGPVCATPACARLGAGFGPTGGRANQKLSPAHLPNQHPKATATPTPTPKPGARRPRRTSKGQAQPQPQPQPQTGPPAAHGAQARDKPNPNRKSFTPNPNFFQMARRIRVAGSRALKRAKARPTGVHLAFGQSRQKHPNPADNGQFKGS
jgi:hypothetical protein